MHSKFRVDYVDNGEKVSNMILDWCTNVDIHVYSDVIVNFVYAT